MGEKYGVGKQLEMPFVCSECENLTIVHNPLVYFREGSMDCNECRLDELLKGFGRAVKGDASSQGVYDRTMQHIYQYNYKTP